MLTELYDDLCHPIVLNCRRAVFRDRNGTPFCVVLEHADGQYWVRHAGEPEFQEALQLMGINDTVVVHHIKAPASDAPKTLVLNDL